MFRPSILKNYREKVNHYLKEHQDDLVIYKLRHGKVLGEEDIRHLEKILWHDLGTKEDYAKTFAGLPMTKLVLSLVGLDRQAVEEKFSKFLSDEALSPNQMAFVKSIVDYITENGGIEKRVLNEHPFNQHGSVTELFGDRMDVIKGVIFIIDKFGKENI